MSAPIRLHERTEAPARRPRFAICTLGCKLNQADESEIRRELRRAGLFEVGFSDPAEVYIVNTCTVTHLADRRSRQMLRRARRRNEHAVVAAIGCYPAVAPEDLEAMPEVDLVVGSIDKLTVVDDILHRVGLPHVAFDQEYLPGKHEERTRRMVKIQEGCRAHCTYCVIPTARGGPQNFEPDDIVGQIDAAEREGFREVVLTGTHVGTYKWKTQECDTWRLADLLEHVLENTTIPRLRVTSVGPHEIDSRFIEILKQPRVMPHLHMALQSGSATVLRRMKRWYNLQQFRRAVRYLREAIPGIGLTTDVIVGFPGETDVEFTETLQFVEEIGFSKIHVFPFSARRGTAAAEMRDPVPPSVKDARAAQLRALSDRLSLAFHQAQLGQQFDVLLEQRHADKDSGNVHWSGLTGNYVRVFVPDARNNLENEIVTVSIVSADTHGVTASPPRMIG
jgi:threonylcarbamoyladenosine tRNA methylthiotransferase MtaB